MVVPRVADIRSLTKPLSRHKVAVAVVDPRLVNLLSPVLLVV